MRECNKINCPTCNFEVDETFVEQKCPRCQTLIESKFICGSCHSCINHATSEKEQEKNPLKKLLSIFKE